MRGFLSRHLLRQGGRSSHPHDMSGLAPQESTTWAQPPTAGAQARARVAATSAIAPSAFKRDAAPDPVNPTPPEAFNGPASVQERTKVDAAHAKAAPRTLRRNEVPPRGGGNARKDPGQKRPQRTLKHARRTRPADARPAVAWRGSAQDAGHDSCSSRNRSTSAASMKVRDPRLLATSRPSSSHRSTVRRLTPNRLATSTTDSSRSGSRRSPLMTRLEQTPLNNPQQAPAEAPTSRTQQPPSGLRETAKAR